MLCCVPDYATSFVTRHSIFEILVIMYTINIVMVSKYGSIFPAVMSTQCSFKSSLRELIKEKCRNRLAKEDAARGETKLLREMRTCYIFMYFLTLTKLGTSRDAIGPSCQWVVFL